MMRNCILVMLLSGCASVQPMPGHHQIPTGTSTQAASPVIEGIEWRAMDIDGAPAARPGPNSLSLRLRAGQAAGVAGCNHYSGSYELLPGQRIRFGTFGATRMLCAGAAMELERSFFAALSGATRYDVHSDDQGTYLTLSAENDRSIRFRRQP